MVGKSKMNSRESSLNKINKEDMTGSDVKEVLCFSDDFFNDTMNRFKEIHKEKLNYYDLKKENSIRYNFKKQWNSLFLTLLEAVQLHPNYNRHKDKKHYTFEGLSQYNQKLIEGINKYLADDLKEFIKWHPAYKAVQEQGSLIKDVEKNLAEIMIYINMMPDTARVEGLIELNKYLDGIKTHLIYCYTDFLERNAIKKSMASKENPDTIDIAFSQNLEELILDILNKFIYEKITIADLNDTEAGELISSDILRDMDYLVKITDEYNKIQDKIKNNSENVKIIQKVKEVLDETNPNERLLIIWLEQALVNMQLNLIDDKELKGKLKVMDTIINNYDALNGLRNLNNKK